jgi:hypothetical protein
MPAKCVVLELSDGWQDENCKSQRVDFPAKTF